MLWQQFKISAITLGMIAALSACGASGVSQSASNQNSATAASSGASSNTEAIAPQAQQKFLDENAKRTDVKTTGSGLQYSIIKEGSGDHPKPTDIVSVLYEGKLIDGTVFDSTAQHGNTPARFPLNQVIPGWTEGLQLMKVGGESVFYIPAKLAYGENGVPGHIPPNATLIFNVKLVKIQQ